MWRKNKCSRILMGWEDDPWKESWKCRRAIWMIMDPTFLRINEITVNHLKWTRLPAQQHICHPLGWKTQLTVSHTKNPFGPFMAAQLFFSHFNLTWLLNDFSLKCANFMQAAQNFTSALLTLLSQVILVNWKCSCHNGYPIKKADYILNRKKSLASLKIWS